MLLLLVLPSWSKLLDGFPDPACPLGGLLGVPCCYTLIARMVKDGLPARRTYANRPQPRGSPEPVRLEQC